ncbi:MAG: YcxB family protein [Verrucomicrobiota bacterium]
MKFTATYDVTARIQEDSVKQYYWHVLLRPRIGGMLVVFAALLVMIALDSPYKPWFVGFFTATFLFLIITWVKVYFQIIAQARAGLKLMENPKVEISLDESLIEYESSTGTRRHQWEKIERIEETKDFVVLMNGKLPLLILPKAFFSDEALTFLKERSRTKHPTG